MGQKIKHLEGCGELKGLPAGYARDLEQLNDVRNDMVHSVVWFATMKGGPVAVYTNTATSSVVPTSRVANLPTHMQLTTKIDKLIKQLAA